MEGEHCGGRDKRAPAPGVNSAAQATDGIDVKRWHFVEQGKSWRTGGWWWWWWTPGRARLSETREAGLGRTGRRRVERESRGGIRRARTTTICVGVGYDYSSPKASFCDP